MIRTTLMLTLAAAVVGLVSCDARTRAQGTVIGNDGNPIPGAAVRLTLAATSRTKETITAQDGEFSVELIHGPFAGRFDLLVSKQGYGDYRQQVPAKTSQTFRIVLKRTEISAAESYAVYSALLAQHYGHWFGRNKTVQIKATTEPPHHSHGDYFARCTASAEDETDRELIQRLLSQVDQKEKLEPKLNLPGQYVLVQKGSNIRETTEPGIVTLSSVVFSSDGMRAMVWVKNVCGSLCGSGVMWRVDRTVEGWRAIHYVPNCGFIR